MNYLDEARFFSKAHVVLKKTFKIEKLVLLIYSILEMKRTSNTFDNNKYKKLDNR